MAPCSRRLLILLMVCCAALVTSQEGETIFEPEPAVRSPVQRWSEPSASTELIETRIRYRTLLPNHRSPPRKTPSWFDPDSFTPEAAPAWPLLRKHSSRHEIMALINEQRRANVVINRMGKLVLDAHLTSEGEIRLTPTSKAAAAATRALQAQPHMHGRLSGLPRKTRTDFKALLQDCCLSLSASPCNTTTIATKDR